MDSAPLYATIRRVWDETPSLTGVLLEVPPDVAAKYERPGQVLVLRPTETDKVYLAIASSPGEADGLELLVGTGARHKLDLTVGATIALDPPSGRGFPIEMAKDQDVLLFAVGSALAPLRPLIETIRKNRSDYGRVTLYIGCHTDADFPYLRHYDAWRRDRIDIVRAVSKPWVQDLFRQEPPDVSRAVAFICGMKPMMDAVEATLIEAGLPAERIGKNW